MSADAFIDAAFPYLIGASVAGIAVLTASSQSDYFSRKLLSPLGLHAKRHAEYRYYWQRALERAEIKLLMFYFGKQAWDKEDDDAALMATTIVQDTNEISQLIKQITSKKGSISDDNKEPLHLQVGQLGPCKHNNNANALFTWLYSDTQSTRTIYQLPLLSFVDQWSEYVTKSIIRTQTYCWVIDAAAGQGTNMLQHIVNETKQISDTVELLPQPLWLANLAYLVATKGNDKSQLDDATIEKVIFSMTTLQTFTSNQLNTDKKRKKPTIAIMVSASVASVLLQYIHCAFPDDRHVFLYSTATEAIEYALSTLNNNSGNAVPATWTEATSFFADVDKIVHTVPLLDLPKTSPVHVMPTFIPALQQLPSQSYANTLQTWMSIVDAFLVRKLADVRKNEYLPYVGRLEFFLSSSPAPMALAIASSANNYNKTELEMTSDKVLHWSARSFIQYLTGTRTSEVSSETLDAVTSICRDLQADYENNTRLSPHMRQAVEKAIFTHKLILIGHKTLTDTVQPAQHWQLKALAKRGCACCLPEEEDEGAGKATRGNLFVVGNDTKSQSAGFDNNSGSDQAESKSTTDGSDSNIMASGYVDGKMKFAFDPTQFTGMS